MPSNYEQELLKLVNQTKRAANKMLESNTSYGKWLREEGETRYHVSTSDLTLQERLEKTKEAYMKLHAAAFVASENGYGEVESERYIGQCEKELKELLGITELFCPNCGVWFSSEDYHNCME